MTQKFGIQLKKERSASDLGENDEQPDTGELKSFGGLQTLPNFYHKDLNQLLGDFEKKMSGSTKIRDEYINKEIVSKMKEKIVYGGHLQIMKQD